ncbi:MAG: hypothetical protein LBT98_01060 [Puniceicoccales bacterium]|jgi:hypothetical protein|nr:hypothetical protein [Puniceicoccales bacterium]
MEILEDTSQKTKSSLQGKIETSQFFHLFENRIIIPKFSGPGETAKQPSEIKTNLNETNEQSSNGEESNHSSPLPPFPSGNERTDEAHSNNFDADVLSNSHNGPQLIENSASEMNEETPFPSVFSLIFPDSIPATLTDPDPTKDIVVSNFDALLFGKTEQLIVHCIGTLAGLVTKNTPIHSVLCALSRSLISNVLANLSTSTEMAGQQFEARRILTALQNALFNNGSNNLRPTLANSADVTNAKYALKNESNDFTLSFKVRTLTPNMLGEISNISHHFNLSAYDTYDYSLAHESNVPKIDCVCSSILIDFIPSDLSTNPDSAKNIINAEFHIRIKCLSKRIVLYGTGTVEESVPENANIVSILSMFLKNLISSVPSDSQAMLDALSKLFSSGNLASPLDLTQMPNCTFARCAFQNDSIEGDLAFKIAYPSASREPVNALPQPEWTTISTTN